MKRTFDLEPKAVHHPRAEAARATAAADSRQRLLDAALDLFGTRGFSETSVRDLAVAARVNLAAVNYYFGGKENLHLEALRYGFAPTTAVAARLALLYDEARLRGTTLAAEEALRQYVQLFLGQVLAEDHKHWNMILREQLTPGPAFKMVMKDYIEPLGRGLSGIVKLLLPGVPKDIRGLCVRSIIGQCVHLRYANGIARYFNKQAHRRANQTFIEESSDHIAEFSIQALRGIRSEYEKSSSRKSTPTSKKPARKGK
jgi:TetR/AcrR family transcriptional regulator, regulator of cefoperazone and chloramphenicol sensitivity